MSQPAQLHFISGKGGVGKSTVAAALALKLSRNNSGPILLIDVHGSGSVFQFLSHPRKVGPKPERCFDVGNLFLCRIDPEDSFKEFLSILMNLGFSNREMNLVPSGVRNQISDWIFENKIVRAFVKACPGLEPISMLGKICWDSRKGHTPEEEIPWAHIVVDGPSTGHFIQMFQSTQALVEVFQKGIISNQAIQILEHIRNRHLSHFYLVTLPEELPLQEALELEETLRALDLDLVKSIVNKAPFSWEPKNSADLPKAWQEELHVESQKWSEQNSLLKQYCEKSKTKPFFLKPLVGIVDKSWLAQIGENLWAT